MKRLVGLGLVAVFLWFAPWDHASRPIATSLRGEPPLDRTAGPPHSLDRIPRTGPLRWASPSFNPGSAVEPPTTIDELREQIAAVLTAHGVPGVGVALVTTDQVIWSGGVGMADRDSERAVGADTVFRVGSISKTVIALAILRLVERGRLRLDAPIRELAPEVAVSNPWEDTDPITVAHLLEHTAGFDDMRFNEWIVAEHEPELPLARVLEINPRSRVVRWRPGSRHAYSNPGYTVAGYIVEKVTGEPFEAYVEREILRPLGMDHAGFSVSPTLRDRLAQGYRGPRLRPVPLRRMHHRPAGELMASPRELAALVQLFLRRDRLISEASFARMERSETRSHPVFDTAYGLGNYGDTTQPAVTRGHDGGMPGFLSEFRYSRGLGVGYTLLYNASSELTLEAHYRIRRLIFAYLTRGRELPEPPTIEVPEAELARHTGYYELASPRFQLTGFLERLEQASQVTLDGGQLYLAPGDLPRVRLVPTGPDRFRFPGTSGPGIAFTTRADGTRVMLWDDWYFEEGSAWGRASKQGLGVAIWLMDLAVFWNIVWLPGWLWVMFRIRQRMPMPPGSLAALTSLGFFVMLKLFGHGAETLVLGTVNGLTVAVFILSAAFPVCALLAVHQWVRWLQPGRAFEGQFYDMLVEGAGFLSDIYRRGWYASTYSVATAAACVAMAAYFTWHGFVALRTWVW